MGGIVWQAPEARARAFPWSASPPNLCSRRKWAEPPALVVVTDRNDLDGQLFQTFVGARSLLR
ncbi:MAG: hypothetical protein IPH39_18145 [Sulfuritalea sp.]|nr:hypothetical protein [Sulfuritalea sp.]